MLNIIENNIDPSKFKLISYDHSSDINKILDYLFHQCKISPLDTFYELGILFLLDKNNLFFLWYVIYILRFYEQF